MTDKHVGSSLPFSFPSYWYTPFHIVVYNTSGKKTLALLCSKTPCEVCSKSLTAFISHVDCFNLAKRNLSNLTLSSLWLVGLYSRLGAGLQYPPRRSHWVSPVLAAYMYKVEEDNFADFIIGGFGKLSDDVWRTIASYCPDCPLWRYNVAVTWSPENLLRLETSESFTLSLSDLPNWVRGVRLPSFDQLPMTERKFVRMSLDGDGIQRIEYLTSWPEASSIWSPVQGVWYVIESLHLLAHLQFQSRVIYTGLGIYSR